MERTCLKYLGVIISRRERWYDVVESILKFHHFGKMLGLEMEIVTIVGGFSTALARARGTDLIATDPERHTGNLRAGMHPCWCPCRRSRFQFSGTLGWMPIQHIAGCAGAFGTLAWTTHPFINTRKSC